MRFGVALCLMAALAACGPRLAPAPTGIREYQGVETRLLEGDLVSFVVSMKNAGSTADLDAYAACAAAQYALIRGYGFARHVRTTVDEKGGIFRADAVYTISAALPRGAATIDAEVTVANCTEQGIPTV